MDIGFVGVGKMGMNMIKRLVKHGHRVFCTARSATRRSEAEAAGAQWVEGLGAFRTVLAAPRAVWSMVPAGSATEETLQALAESLEPGDLIVDGGNSDWRDSRRRHAEMARRPRHFLDVGTSGGIWGLSEGYSLMIGGEPEIVEHLRPLFETLAPAPDRGWGHVGTHGAGHFVKMVHNGIEYGMMQALAEGFEILHRRSDLGLDVAQIAEIWRFGSVVRSWLLDLTARALKENADLDGIKGWVADSGEGRWTVAEAIDQDIPAPVITLSLLMRFVSRQDDSYAAKLLAAMRNQFGGHPIKREDG
jgi:6-phosphogluconate dehydrogenase